MILLRKCTATKQFAQGVLLFALWAMATLALAGPVAGTVVHLSGPLFAKKADGTVKVLSLKSEVENGDTLMTEKNTYALVRFIDNSEMTLKPGSTMTVENFSFDSGQQDKDQASFKLVKGGLRSVTGLLGKRSKEKFELKTPSATIGIRGTTFIAEYVGAVALPSASAPGSNGAMLPSQGASLAQVPAPPMPGNKPPGLYVQVLDGMVVLSNGSGAQNFAAGQFGFVPSSQLPPVILPSNPGMQFSPPPAFHAPAQNGNTAPQQSNAVDCIVR
ncbi:FecR family protein [Pseudoduganella sp. OTU4001]|uniref:FecR family protein n=1 Tax=Pseudoduganella sp. OTU4001 TaxID=3043854 RepID=UPI00313C37FC